ncbi:MAG TPA: glycoside hydrolase family 15 protein [Stellaceae bacterium]|nr:glycoside hydrolase family 15 protein [Stellaceae bacterium]
MSTRIEDYALIGDCETAALVARDGSIDWLCWPRFDGGACFAALLGTRDNGRWKLAPADPAPCISRHYRPDTLILETEFETNEGAVTLIDFMPPRGQASDVVRLVVGKRGRVAMEMDLTLRFDYGSIIPWVTRLEDGTLRAIAGPDMVVLRTPVLTRGENMHTVAEFMVAAGETIPFALTYGRSHLPVPAPIDTRIALAETQSFWEEWASRCRPAGRWSAAVRRSLITLKALTYRPTGGIVAAPTTSLPEKIGGSRNWDYRYCWVRDATYTLLAMMNAGLYDEAQAWREWLPRAVAGAPDQIQILYGLAGERHLNESELPWLQGFEGSRPVRIGNQAAAQCQLDIYGEVMDALHQARSGRLSSDHADWALQLALLGHLERIWREPDEGIWEVRGGRRQFTHSKVMAWVAFDRAIAAVERFGLPGDVAHWRAVRATIHEEICRQGFNPTLGAFTQSYGSPLLDASLLMIPLVGFLPAADPRVQSTVRLIEQRLMREGFVERYDTKADGGATDGLPPGEGVFIACSFWLADNFILAGRRREAAILTRRLMTLCNDVGLLSEEYDPIEKRLLGNFPQAFSHIAFINTAYALADAGRRRATPERTAAPVIAEAETLLHR